MTALLIFVILNSFQDNASPRVVPKQVRDDDILELAL